MTATVPLPPQTTAEIDRALQIAREMAKAGIPIFVAPPAPGTKVGFRLPSHWEQTVPDPRAVDAWQPGWALCAVGGHLCDFLDIDPRNGGNESAVSLNGQRPIWYGRQATPSGGTHDVIAPLGVGKGEVLPGIDLQGGRPDGTGRGFVFIAPTVKRAKTDGITRPYRWLQEPDLPALIHQRSSDHSGSALAAMQPQRKSKPKAAEVGDDFDDFNDGPPDSRTHTVEQANRTIVRKGEAVTAAARRGWGQQFHDTLSGSSYTFGGYDGYIDEDYAVNYLSACIQLAGHEPNDDDVFTIRDQYRRGSKDLFKVVNPSRPLAQDHSANVPDPSQWTPIDLTGILSGDQVIVEAELGKRTDGVALIYRGKEHAIAGEPESGKTWFMLMIVVDVLRSGGRVVYVDFEDDENTIVGRLLGMGLDKTLLHPDVFRYVRPEGAPAEGVVTQLLTFPDGAADLVAFDGWTEGASLLGLDVIKGQDDVAKWRQALIKPALFMGAATLTTDHVVKDPDNRGRYGIGAQHKLGGLTGAMFTIEVANTWGKGSRGVSRVLVTKDRNGGLRPHGIPTKQPNITHIGDLVGDASFGSLSSVVIFPPGSKPESDGQDEHHDGPPKALARHVSLISDLLRKRAAAGKELINQTDLLGQIPGNNQTKIAALKWLTEGGKVRLIEGPNGGQLPELADMPPHLGSVPNGGQQADSDGPIFM